MVAFGDRLKGLNPQLDINYEMSEKYMSYLNYHTDRSNAFTHGEKGPWVEEYRKFEAAQVKPDRLRKIIDLAEDQRYIRDQLPKLGLCAFVANGSILPRESGVSSKPMRGAVKFQSPKEQEVTITLPHAGVISGMGIKRGITLIVGGGYHGKSTLLKALETGVYPHVAGDGREYVITDDTAVKIRAEDGRSIKKTDISMVINDLPNGQDTVLFCTEDASGSTSQAANVIESMEAGTSLFLIDEDTSATNFMIRDELMQRVIHREMEPITPFIERIRELYEKQGISTVIVAGSSGAYFHIADTILQMDRYEPKDITGDAKKEAEAFPAISLSQEPARQPDFKRCPIANADLKGNDRICYFEQFAIFDVLLVWVHYYWVAIYIASILLILYFLFIHI